MTAVLQEEEEKRALLAGAGALTGIGQVGVGGGVVLDVVLLRVPVLVPVADEALRVVRVLVHPGVACSRSS